MTPTGRVKVAKRSYSTPAKWQVAGVLVRKANSLRPKVEACARENAVGEVPAKARVAGKQPAEAVIIILVDTWGPGGKGSCIGPQWTSTYGMDRYTCLMRDLRLALWPHFPAAGPGWHGFHQNDIGFPVAARHQRGFALAFPQTYRLTTAVGNPCCQCRKRAASMFVD